MKRAFTLIELLIAALIFTVILYSVYFSFNSGMFGYRRIEETLDVSWRAQKTLDRINSDLRNSFMHKPENAYFNGTNQEMAFFALENGLRNGTRVLDYASVLYRLDGSRLLRLCRPNSESLKDKSLITPVVLCAQVKNITFSYAGTVPGTAALEWKAAWGVNATLPRAVKITLNLDSRSSQEYNFERTVYLPLSQ